MDSKPFTKEEIEAATRKIKADYPKHSTSFDHSVLVQCALTHAQSALIAMTEDRDRWQEAHEDDCPNANLVETLREELARKDEELREARKAIEIIQVKAAKANTSPYPRRPMFEVQDIAEEWITRNAQKEPPCSND